MNCKLCNTKNMDFIFCDDQNQARNSPDYAYNLYHCVNCGGLVKEDVWHENNQTWIPAVPEIKDDKAPTFELSDPVVFTKDGEEYEGIVSKVPETGYTYEVMYFPDIDGCAQHIDVPGPNLTPSYDRE